MKTSWKPALTQYKQNMTTNFCAPAHNKTILDVFFVLKVLKKAKSFVVDFMLFFIIIISFRKIFWCGNKFLKQSFLTTLLAVMFFWKDILKEINVRNKGGPFVFGFVCR